MNVKDMEVAKSLFNPKRMRIIKLIEDHAMTVKEMASELNDKPSRLYYHVHKLVEQGLVEAADSKQVGHLTETYYQAVPGMGSFDIDYEFGKEHSDYIIKELLMHVNRNIDVLKEDLKNAQPEMFRSQASLLQAKLSRDEWQSLNREIRALVDKRTNEAKDSDDKNKLSINFTMLSYTDEEHE